MSILTGVTIAVYADKDYHYEVGVHDEISLTCKEQDREDVSIGFGSLDEMEATARAMLQAVSVAHMMKNM